jgi:hypothetical protein
MKEKATEGGGEKERGHLTSVAEKHHEADPKDPVVPGARVRR